MPELPEVYTTVKGLKENIIGLKIINVWSGVSSSAKLFRNTIKNKSYFKEFLKNVIGAKVKSVEQNAKNILINLNNDFTIVVHMKMTGQLLYGEWSRGQGERIFNETIFNNQTNTPAWKPVDKKSLHNDPYSRHIRAVFTFSNGKQLALSDARKFGTIEIFKTNELYKKFDKVGPTPLDKNFSLKILKERLSRSSRDIKIVLMDQKLIGGIGNIYSDEILFDAHILPFRKTKSLKENEWKLLFKSMKEILKKGIKFGGDSMSDYRNIFGEKGDYQNKHLVYRRTGEKCVAKGCSGIIKRKVIGGRSAHYCSICQV